MQAPNETGKSVDRRLRTRPSTTNQGLLLRKLACQTVFVISFYDLSKLDNRHRSALHTDASDRIIALGETLIDKTDGA